MKMTEPKKVVVQNTTFYIYPFSAFKAANMSGELISVLGPAIGGIASILTDNSSSTGEGNATALDADINFDKIGEAMGSAFRSLSGDKVESLLRQLLVQYKNITVEIDKDVMYLDEETLDEIFCGEVQGMFVLAYHVIATNFNGFFTKLSNLSGTVAEKAKTVLTTSKDTES